MLDLGGAPRTILCLGAHSDDLEIGCAGTIMALLASRPGVDFHWVVFSGRDEREREARASAERMLAPAGRAHVDVERFSDGYFPWEGASIKRYFEGLKRAVSPDLILTHYRGDRHQDHRTISELTWNTFRDHWILEYEVPKYDGDFGQPNTFVALTDQQRRAKVELLMDCFASQRSHGWFTPETFNAVMRLRGMECAAPTGYAEAFYGHKLRLGFEPWTEGGAAPQ